MINIKKMKITIVGTGAFATAVGNAMVSDKENKNDIILFGIDKNEINDINKNNENSKYFDVKLSPKLKATDNAKEAFDNVDIILLVVPSKAIRIALTKSIIPNLNKPAYFVNLAKGFDFENNEILSNIIEEIIPKKFNKGILKLSGASFAAEIINNAPTSFVLASKDIKTSKEIVGYLSNHIMKIKPTGNIKGVEWVSVTKNPLAILLGIIHGLGYEINTTSMFFTQAVNDMEKILKYLKLDCDILLTTAGIGDLYLTGTSSKSRNFTTGMAIGKANKVTKNLLEMFATVEGIRTIEILLKISNENKLELKSLEILYSIIYDNVTPSVAVKEYIKNIGK